MKSYQRKARTDREKGFTLVEILIALTIFAIGMLAIANMQVWGIVGNATAKWHTEAATWASDRIERLMTLDYAHADLAAGPHPGAPITEGHYSISWNVTDSTPIPNAKAVVVTVTWKDRGKNKSTAFTYYKADL